MVGIFFSSTLNIVYRYVCRSKLFSFTENICLFFLALLDRGTLKSDWTKGDRQLLIVRHVPYTLTNNQGNMSACLVYVRSLPCFDLQGFPSCLRCELVLPIVSTYIRPKTLSLETSIFIIKAKGPHIFPACPADHSVWMSWSCILCRFKINYSDYYLGVCSPIYFFY